MNTALIGRLPSGTAISGVVSSTGAAGGGRRGDANVGGGDAGGRTADIGGAAGSIHASWSASSSLPGAVSSAAVRVNSHQNSACAPMTTSQATTRSASTFPVCPMQCPWPKGAQSVEAAVKRELPAH